MKDTGARTIIDMSDPHQAKWWCDALGVTREELWQAVRTVGNAPDAVRSYLSAGRTSPAAAGSHPAAASGQAPPPS